MRDLPCFEYRTTVVIELYRVKCPDCGVRAEKVAQLPSKAPFSKRFEDAIGQACENAAARRVAKQFGLAESTVRGMDLRYREQWATARRRPALRQMGVDEIHIGKKQKFLTGVCNLETGRNGAPPSSERSPPITFPVQPVVARRALPTQLLRQHGHGIGNQPATGGEVS